MHVLCSCEHTGTGVCPRYVQRNTHPRGLGRTGHPEPLRAASSAPTPAEPAPGTPSAGARKPSSPAALPSAGSGRALRAPSRTGQVPLSPRTRRPPPRRPRGYQRGSGWLRRARGAPGEGASALALRLMCAWSPHEPPLSSAHASLTCSRREGSPRPGRHTRQASVPGTGRAPAAMGPAGVRSHSGHRDWYLFIRLLRTSRLSGLRSPIVPGLPGRPLPKGGPAPRRSAFATPGARRCARLPAASP